MKSIRNLFAIVMLLACAALAASPTWSAYDGTYLTELDTTISVTDSLVGNDSARVLANYNIDHSYEYILCGGAWAGSGTDSVHAIVRVYAKEDDGDTMYYTEVDSFTSGTVGKAINLGVWGAVWGDKIDIVLYGRDTKMDASSGARFPTFWLWKRQPYSISPSRPR